MDGLDEARALLPGVHLSSEALLVGGERSEVRRVRARWPDSGETSVVVKRFLTAGESWAREAAALHCLPDDAPAPKAVAEGAAPPVVVMTDLGDGPSVAAALLGDDADLATGAVLDWARAMARLHRSTFGARAAFRAELALRAGDVPIADHRMTDLLTEAAALLEARCLDLDVAVPAGALRDLRGLTRRLGAGGRDGTDCPAALSPSDSCPDDNVRTGDGLALVDFEGAQWRHIAWDVSYLVVPWPTCWCSWRMPSDVAERALERYRTELEDTLPYVRTTEFRDDVTLAALGWALVSTAFLLPGALGGDPPPANPRKVTPTRRAMILHRLDGARRHGDLEPTAALAQLCGRLRAALTDRWGEVPLGYAPAFERAD